MTDEKNQDPLRCSHCHVAITGAYRAYKDEAFHTSGYPACAEAYLAHMRTVGGGSPRGPLQPSPAMELTLAHPTPEVVAVAEEAPDWTAADLVDPRQLRLPGVKADQGKLRYDLFPPEAEEEIVQALTHGAAKYTDEGWREVPNGRSRYFAALRRHLNSWRRGERTDQDSGLPHLACAGACLVFLLELDRAEKDAPPA